MPNKNETSNGKNSTPNPSVSTPVQADTDSKWKKVDTLQEAIDHVTAAVNKDKPLTSEYGKVPTTVKRVSDPNFVDDWQEVPLKTVMLGESDKDEDSRRHHRFANFAFQARVVVRDEKGIRIQTSDNVVSFGGTKGAIAKELKALSKKRKEESLKQLKPISEMLEKWGRTLTSETDTHTHKFDDGTIVKTPMSIVYGETVVGLVREMASGGKDKFFTKKAFESVKAGGTMKADNLETENGRLYLSLNRAAFDNGGQMVKFVSIVCNAARLAYEGKRIEANNKLDLLARDYAVSFGFGSSDVEVRAMLELFAQVIQLRLFGISGQEFNDLASKLEKEAKEDKQQVIIERMSDAAIEKAKEAQRLLDNRNASADERKAETEREELMKENQRKQDVINAFAQAK